MIPVLLGRIQTRVFVTLVVGLPWTVVVTPLLALATGEAPMAMLGTLVTVQVVATAVGCLFWEPVWHGLMQLRWEKDWPALFHLLQALPESITTVVALGLLGVDVPGLAFVLAYFSTWIVTWLFANGPMKIFFLRWRFNGGRLV